MTSISIPQALSLNGSGGSGNQIWLDGRQGIVELSWKTGLLEQVRSYVASTYVSRNGKSEDVGGVFFGYRRGEVMQVMTWRPISRGKDATAHFYLNSKEEQGLKKLLISVKSDGALQGMEVLGWFRSRTKSEAELDQHDVRFHEKFFGQMYQLAMVIKPSHQRPAEAAVYVRDAEGEFQLDEPVAMLSLEQNSREFGPAEIYPWEANLSNRKNRFPWMQVGSVMLAGIVVAFAIMLALQWNHKQSLASESDRLAFEVEFDGGELKAHWNRTSNFVLKSDNAQLILGGEKLQLSHAELAQGYLRIPMTKTLAGDTEVSLKVGDYEEVAQLVTAAR